MRIKKLNEFDPLDETLSGGAKPDKNKVASYKRGKGKTGRAVDFYSAGKAAEQTPQNFRKASDCLKTALRSIKDAYEELQKMPVVDLTEEIPDLLKDLEDILFYEDMSGDKWKNYTDRLDHKTF